MSVAADRDDLRRPFGDAARRFTAGLPHSISVIAAEPEQAALAVAAAADLKRRGILFYAAVLLDDPRSLLAQTLSGQLLAQFQSVDERRLAFDSLARGQSGCVEVGQSAFRLAANPQLRVLRDLIILSDAGIARSSVDAATIAHVCGYRRRFNVIVPGTDPDVPSVVSRERRSIVVWAPRLPAARLGVIAMATELFKSDVVFVCASGELPGVHGSFVQADRGAASLASAACILDASISDPAAAIRLARIGVPVVAASTSGAAEFVSGIFEYDPWDFRSVHAAVARSRGAQPPVAQLSTLPDAALRDMLALSGPPALSNGPLVSVVLPTYNRPVSLAKSLDYIAAQTYKTLDVIVVNDGGVDIGDVCARYPFVRLVNLEKNVGNPGATHAGMKEVRGKYFGFWGDDDWYFPDHFARVVYALETSGCDVAHTQSLTRYCQERADGTERTRAYKVLHDRPNDPVEMMTGPTMTFGAMLFRHEVIQEIGYADPNSALIDVEYQLRASQRYDFVAIDAVTLQWNYKQNSYTHQIGESRFVADQKAIYARYPSELTCVNGRRAAWLKKLAEHFNTVIWPPDVLLPEDFPG